MANRGGGAGRTLPANWREILETALSLDPDQVTALGVDGAEQLRELHRMAAEHGRRVQDDLAALLEENGATELAIAVRAGAVKVADLGVTSTATLRPANLDPDNTRYVQIWNWIDALVSRLTDRQTRLLFDRQAGSMTQSMLAEGTIPASPQGLRLAAQAALGAGFTERLPAFPTAKMDELLDLRKELALPLARYRGAVMRFSKDVPAVVGDDLTFEVQQLWEETVKPTLMSLEDEMADHGLVKEIARSLDVQDIRNFGTWTAGTYLVVASASDLDALTTGLIATATTGVPRAASLTLDAVRARRAAARDVESNEFFYLYEANQRLA